MRYEWNDTDEVKLR